MLLIMSCSGCLKQGEAFVILAGCFGCIGLLAVHCWRYVRNNNCCCLASLQDPNLTFGDWATRTAARIAEIKTQQDSVAAVSITGPDGTTATVGQVLAAFQAAGATTAWLPAAPAVGSPVAIADYNLATWDGNTTAYLSCNLELRGPEYLGTCTDMPVTCAGQTNDTAPYACTRIEDNSTVSGSIRNSTYR
jgi:hypothetical protein